MQRRILIQWILAPLALVIITLGWKYPLLGFLVPIVMMIGIIGAFFNGRYVCGNLCPRGALFDRVLVLVSPQHYIPNFLRNMSFRISLLILLMGFMVYQLSRNITSWEHWGYVFWLMCTVTTLLGVILAFFIRPRTWCAFCPIGTLGKMIGKNKCSLTLDGAKCIKCRLCETVCPMNLSIITADKHLIPNADCIKCFACVQRCSKKALRNCNL